MRVWARVRVRVRLGLEFGFGFGFGLGLGIGCRVGWVGSSHRDAGHAAPGHDTAAPPPSPPPPPAPPHILLPSAPPLTVPWPAPSLPPSRPCRSQEAVDEPESDVAGLLRIILGCVLGLCALIGPVLVLVTHVLAQQKAPVVNDGSEELAPSAI